MRLSSLDFLFKSTSFQPEHIKSYITSLLNKFEVALQFDEEHLLLPSLLPTEAEILEMARCKSDVRIPLMKDSEHSVSLSRDLTVSLSVSASADAFKSRRSGRRLTDGPPSALHVGSSVFYTGAQSVRDRQTTRTFSDPQLLLLKIKPTHNPIFSSCRLYFMTYFPSGFWPRLITRVLADSSIDSIVRELFLMPKDLISSSPEVKNLSEKSPEWRCWQTGFELFHLGFEMLRIREVFFSTSSYMCDYSQCRVKCSIDNEWAFLDVVNSKILEISFPTDSLKFHLADKDGPRLQNLDLSKPSSTVYRQEVATTKLLVKIVEHVDNLLQDWYPDLGELRFTQNCEGRYLVTRVVPCPQCLTQEVMRQKKTLKDDDTWFFLNPDVPDMCMPVVVQGDNQKPLRERSVTAAEADGSRSPVKSRPRTLTEGQAFIYNRSSPESEPVIFSWLVERCMLDVLENVNSVCPVHGSISPLYLLNSDGVGHHFNVAPDVVFQDQSLDLLLPSSAQLDIGKCLGKGTFGEVYKGKLYSSDTYLVDDVAVKVVFKQTHDRRDISKGFQSYLEQACQAYLTCRQEMSILCRLQHPHIVPLLALNLQPLSLLLSLAPLGGLDARLKELNSRGEHLALFVIRSIVIQVAKAMSYLHEHSIIYRDLKSDNVLVWNLPSHLEAHPTSKVDVKIADYGISRSVLPSGAKGFGGTPPFIAPEILQHAGKGTYTEKVDVFSFGMFLFEILTCRVPFANVNQPNNLICQGERPSLSVQETERVPLYILDLMTICLSHDPESRPSMQAVLGMSSSPQFCHLEDAVSLGPDLVVYCGTAVSAVHNSCHSVQQTSSPEISDTGQYAADGDKLSQIWLCSGYHDNNSIEIFTFNHSQRVETYRTLSVSGSAICAMCVLDGVVWCVNSDGLIQIFHAESADLVQQIQLPRPATSTHNAVLSLHPLPSQSSVLAVLSDGTIYQCPRPARGLPTSSHDAVTTHQSSPCLCSVLVVLEDRCEVWMGAGHGQVYIWDTHTHQQEVCLSHGPKMAATSTSCIFLVTQTGATAEVDTKYIWSYNYPGSVVCMWDAAKRIIVERLDTASIVSTVDSPILMASQSLECGQLTSLSAIDQYLYMGTTRGSVLITSALTLTPLCVFQCHSNRDFYVKAILPILPFFTDGHKDENLKEGGDDEEEEEDLKKVPAVVTIGKGYSNVLKTFHPTLDLSRPGVSTEDSNISLISDNKSPPIDPYASHTFLLSWRAQDWEYF